MKHAFTWKVLVIYSRRLAQERCQCNTEESMATIGMMRFWVGGLKVGKMYRFYWNEKYINKAVAMYENHLHIFQIIFYTVLH